MRKIYIIGTIHKGYTSKEELGAVLKNLSPNQVLVELPDQPIEKTRKSTDVRDEMMFAYDWAKENNIRVDCFDNDVDILREGMTLDHPKSKELMKYHTGILKHYSWKDLNKKEHAHTMDSPLEAEIADPIKQKNRENQMLKNIRGLLIPDGNVVILTGTAHLPFFEHSIPEAIFPLR